MQGKVKRPPVSLSDLQGDKREEHKPGPLGYQEKQSSQGGSVVKQANGSSKGKGGGKLGTLMLFVIAIILPVVFTVWYAATKADLVVVNNNTQNRISQMRPALDRLDNIINTQASYVRKVDLEGYAKQGDIKALMDQIEQLQTTKPTPPPIVQTPTPQISQLTLDYKADNGILTLDISSPSKKQVSFRVSLAYNYVPLASAGSDYGSAISDFYTRLDKYGYGTSYIPTIVNVAFKGTDGKVARQWYLVKVEFDTVAYSIKEGNSSLSIDLSNLGGFSNFSGVKVEAK